MSYKDYISDDEIFEEDDLDEDNLDEEDFDEDDFDEDDYDDDREYDFKVVGVTFNNDDGTSRQEILRKIKNREEPFNRYINYTLRVYSFEGEPAVAVEANGIMIGNMPKEDAKDVAENIERIESVSARVYGGEGDKKYGARATLTLKRIKITFSDVASYSPTSTRQLSNGAEKAASQENKPDFYQVLKAKSNNAVSEIKAWLKSPISKISVILIIVFFGISVALSVALNAKDSKDYIEPIEVTSATNLVVDGKFTVDRFQLVEKINALPEVSYSCDKSFFDDKAYYSGDIQDGIDLTIVCDEDRTTVLGMILVSKNEYAKEGGVFLASLLKLLYPNDYKEKCDEFLEKIKLEEMRYGDSNSCYIDNVFFTVEMTSEEVTVVMLPKSVK